MTQFNEDTIEKTITITSIEDSQSGKLITLKEGNDKYKIWKTKKDGLPTVAFTQFTERTLGIGASVPIVYKEQDKEYKGINYKERTIVFFPSDEAKTPAVSQNEPVIATPEPTDLEKEIDIEIYDTIVRLRLVANDHEKRLRALEAFIKDA